jgi:predicted metal-dependent phosphotriesterase family hydrolase
MKSQRRRLHVLCEDGLHQRFVEGLADRWGIGPRQRKIDASPAARGSASGYVLSRFVAALKRWRAERHDANVGLLVVIDGDERGLARRRQELAQILRDAKMQPIAPSEHVAIVVPTWHVETWIA